MKKTIWVLSAAVVLCLLSVSAFSQCASNLTYAGGAVAGSYWTGYTLNPQLGQLQGISLVVGAGKNSNVYPMTANACAAYASCQSRVVGGNYRTAGQTAQGANAWNLCPDTSTEYITQIIWEKSVEGVDTHTARFAAATAKYVGASARWDFSQAMTPQSNKVFQVIPAPYIQNSTNQGGGNWSFILRLNIPGVGGMDNNTKFKRQYYDSTITPPVVVTGWRLYSYVGAAAPTTGDITTGGWSYITTVNIPDDTNTFVDYTTGNFALGGANSVWFAMTPQFADGWFPFAAYTPLASSYFVGANSAQAGPTGVSVFGAFNATAAGTTINVSWTSNNESGVTGYQVYSATSVSGPFQAKGSVIAPGGNGHAYNSSFAVAGTKASGTVYVKVKAIKGSGTDEWTDVKKVPYGFSSVPAGGVVK